MGGSRSSAACQPRRIASVSRADARRPSGSQRLHSPLGAAHTAGMKGGALLLGLLGAAVGVRVESTEIARLPYLDRCELLAIP